MASKVSGFDEANAKFRRTINRIKNNRTERFVTEVLIQVSSRAAFYTPVKTSNLINSQFRQLRRAQNGWRGVVGYGAFYAPFVHDAPGTLRFSGKLRDKNRPGWGVYWSPNGRPGFLRIAVDEVIQQDLSSIINRHMRL